MQASVAVLAQVFNLRDMPVELDPPYAQGCSFAMCWGSPLEDGSVIVTFAHGPFQRDAFDEYAQLAWSNSSRRIDGIVAICQVCNFEQVEIIAKPYPGNIKCCDITCTGCLVAVRILVAMLL